MGADKKLSDLHFGPVDRDLERRSLLTPADVAARKKFTGQREPVEDEPGEGPAATDDPRAMVKRLAKIIGERWPK